MSDFHKIEVSVPIFLFILYLILLFCFDTLNVHAAPGAYWGVNNNTFTTNLVNYNRNQANQDLHVSSQVSDPGVYYRYFAASIYDYGIGVNYAFVPNQLYFITFSACSSSTMTYLSSNYSSLANLSTMSGGDFIYSSMSSSATNNQPFGPDLSFGRCRNFVYAMAIPNFTAWIGINFQAPGTGDIINLINLNVYEGGYYQSVSNADIQDKIQEMQDAIIENQTEISNQINDTLTSSEVSDPSSNFDTFDNNLADAGPVTQLFLLPVTLWTRIASSVNSTCSPISLGTLYDYNLIIPCIDVSRFVGDVIWNIVDVISTGFLVFFIAHTIRNAFNKMSNLEEGDVLD